MRSEREILMTLLILRAFGKRKRNQARVLEWALGYEFGSTVTEFDLKVRLNNLPADVEGMPE